MTRWRGVTDLGVALLCLLGIAVVFIGGSVVIDGMGWLEQRLGWFWYRVLFWGALAGLGLGLGWWRWPKNP